MERCELVPLPFWILFRTFDVAELLSAALIPTTFNIVPTIGQGCVMAAAERITGVSPSRGSTQGRSKSDALNEIAASGDLDASVELDRIVSNGVEIAVLKQHPETYKMMVAHKVLPKSTLQHNTRHSSGRLSAANSERFVRALRVRQQAMDAFGPGNADAWLETPLRRLDGRTPMEMLGTEAGARAVEQLIRRAVHGFNA